jgi:hypothetical protein
MPASASFFANVNMNFIISCEHLQQTQPSASIGQNLKFSADIFRLSLKNLSRPKPLLLIPLTVFNGIEQVNQE